MRICLRTGKLIRAYLNVALARGLGSDKIGDNRDILSEVADSYKLTTEDYSVTNDDVANALKTIRKGGGLPSLKEIRKAVAAGSCHVHGQSLKDSPCPEETVDEH